MKSKFTILLTIIEATAFLLSSCGSAAAATVSASDSLSAATRLALGTLKLEGTDLAVTQAQATVLLTLWEAYQSLSQSDTSSQVELDALVKQIQGVMTSEQLKDIDSMNLTEQSVNEVLQSTESNSTAIAPSNTPSTSQLSQAAPSGVPGGGMPPGGSSSSMGDITSGITTPRTPAATQPAASSQSSQVDGRLLNALIQLLETRSQSKG